MVVWNAEHLKLDNSNTLDDNEAPIAPQSAKLDGPVQLELGEAVRYDEQHTLDLPTTIQVEPLFDGTQRGEQQLPSSTESHPSCIKLFNLVGFYFDASIG